MTQPEQYLVVDLEATCDAKGFPRAERETIEIGAVLVDAQTFAIQEEFQSFIQPVRHPHLTDYCTQLTGIQQGTVDAAQGFSDVFSRFTSSMVEGRKVLFLSWGGYDRRQLRRDCRFHETNYPFEGHGDMSLAFIEHAGLTRRISLTSAVAHVGLSIEGAHHRGLDDARNLARILPWCLGRRTFPVLEEDA